MTKKTTVYMSFLGASTYQATRYDWDGTRASETPYAQEAELQLLLKRNEIDASTGVIIFGTKTSKEAHWQRCCGYDFRKRICGSDQGEGLRPRLERLGLDPTFVEISEELSASEQWSTFQTVLTKIPRGARLAVDTTHGYRAAPVVFSSALHFLRLASDVTLTHVLYGAYEADKDHSRIMDYVDFYAIQDWTDAVSRLVEDADARRLMELSKGGSSLPVVAFSEGLTDALMQVTDAVRNVDVHGIEPKVRAALELVREAAAADPQPASKALLNLVQQKFGELASRPPLDGHYSQDYFEVQLRFIALLLEHRLFMQAFTAMREYVGSLGMRAYKPSKLKFTNSDGRTRRSYAEVFLSMVAVQRQEWSFTPQRREQVDKLLPHYEQLAAEGLLEDMRAQLKCITDLRNGFDHAWTSKPEVLPDIAAKGTQQLEYLRQLTAEIFALGPPAQPEHDAETGRRLLVLMNHEPTEAQAADASTNWKVGRDAWLLAPEELSRAWRDIDAAAETTPADLLEHLRAWLDAEAQAGDLFWAQGELGATIIAAQQARDRGLTPIYATTRRESATTQQADGSVTITSRFEHVRFRKLPH